MRADQKLLGEFKTFAELELGTGGPDQHVELVSRVARGSDLKTLAWMAGCYGAVYEACHGAVLWTMLDWRHPDRIGFFVEDNWDKLTMRRERRAVRTPEKLSRCLRGVAEWVAGMDAADLSTYDKMWRDLGDVYGMGRYIAIKVLEVMHRAAGTPEMPDIRPADAWSPRRTLCNIFPDEPNLTEEGNQRERLDAVTRAVEELRNLVPVGGRRLTLFETEVLLCNVRQVKYAGRSLDTDLKYARAAEEGWGRLYLPFYETRVSAFPRQCLGELCGWSAPREELRDTLSEHGYIWSDVVYDYSRTTRAAQPARRER